MSNTVTPLKALSNFFNTGEKKKPLREFAQELKELSEDEKTELATLAAAAMGQTLA